MTMREKLTTRAIAAALRAGKRPRKLSDGGGLYLYLHESGHAYWRLRPYEGDKEPTRASGKYPQLTREQARAAASSSRGGPAATVETGQALKTVEDVARAWYAKKAPIWAS